MEDHVLQAQCLTKVVVEERRADGTIARSELSTALALKKEMGNARLVSDDAMLWVANGSIQSKPVTAVAAAATTESDSSTSPPKQHVTVTNGKRSFSFYLASNADSDSFLVELRAQVAGKSGIEAKRKKRKIRKQIHESQSAGFVPVVNSLASPLRPTPIAPLTPTRRRLSDATNSPVRLAPPLPMTVASTVSEAHGVYPSPSKSPFRSPFRKHPTPPPPRVATPIVSLSLPPKSPAVSFTMSTPSPMAPRSASSSASSMTPPRPREWLSPARTGSGGGAMRVRPQLTPPSLRRESLGTPPGSARSRDSSEKENTPVRASGGGGIVNKRVRSLQRMLDEVPREDLEHTAGVSRPPTVRSPYFLSPSNAREMSPVRRPSPAKKLRSPSMPLGELQPNGTPPLRPLSAKSTPTPPGSNPQSGGEWGLRKVTHGLLNLGNFCYMNAIVQSLAALPGFADHLQKDDWILPIIKKHLAANGTERSVQEIATLLETWKHADTQDRLGVQQKLAVLLQQVIDGSDTAINPEPLKNIMGRRNPRFASHFQQDAHEFLLHLVTEYEKELVEAVEGVLKTAAEVAGSGGEEPSPQPEPAPAELPPTPPRKVSLLNYFRPAKKVEEAVTEKTTTTETAPAEEKASSPAKANEQDALVAELFPADCFRTELYRTLTCCSCQYSRRQVEQFYDFSLDLPFVPMPKSPVQEPQSEPGAAGPATKQCHCGVDAVVVALAGGRFYCCAKSSCSLRDKVEDETPTKADVNLNESSASATTSTASMSPQLLSTASSPPVAERSAFTSIQLADLLRDQFKSEVLELTCEKCKDGREATARYQVKSLPRVLVLHLKRFEVNPQTGFLYKRCDLVEAPRDLLPVQNIHGCDASAADQGDLGDMRYTLRSVVHHLGRTVDEGHYVADVCGPRDGWRRRNDTHETLIGEDFALRASRSQESCYMMFYVLAEPTDAQERDKENVSAEPPTPTRRSSPMAATPPRHPDSPASLVGRRRDMTPLRRNTVSKSLHELL